MFGSETKKKYGRDQETSQAQCAGLNHFFVYGTDLPVSNVPVANVPTCKKGTTYSSDGLRYSLIARIANAPVADVPVANVPVANAPVANVPTCKKGTSDTSGGILCALILLSLARGKWPVEN